MTFDSEEFVLAMVNGDEWTYCCSEIDGGELRFWDLDDAREARREVQDEAGCEIVIFKETREVVE